MAKANRSTASATAAASFARQAPANDVITPLSNRRRHLHSVLVGGHEPILVLVADPTDLFIHGIGPAHDAQPGLV